jgi:hypothetical protein
MNSGDVASGFAGVAVVAGAAVAGVFGGACGLGSSGGGVSLEEPPQPTIRNVEISVQ